MKTNWFSSVGENVEVMRATSATIGPLMAVPMVGKLPWLVQSGIDVTVSHESWMKRKVTRSFELRLWSILTNSSRQFVGWAGAAMKLLPEVGAGIIPSKACAVAWLAANWAEVAGSVAILTTGLPLTIGQSAAGGGRHRSVKSPPRSATEGTTWLKVCPGTTSLRHSSDQKKKVFVLSLL